MEDLYQEHAPIGLSKFLGFKTALKFQPGIHPRCLCSTNGLSACEICKSIACDRAARNFSKMPLVFYGVFTSLVVVVP